MKNEAEIWLVEDNEIFATGVQRAIDHMDGMACGGKYKSVEQAFAALESGHVAQNLALCAAALDLSMITLGGFFDDLVHELAGLDGVDEVAQYLIPLGKAVP